MALTAASPSSAEDALRDVEAKRFGIAVKVPAGWQLIDLARDDRAFVLKLPQENGSASGYVACELGVAPESLEEFRKRHQSADDQEQKRAEPRRTLLLNELQPIDAAKSGAETAGKLGQRLVSVWKHISPEGPPQYEVRARVISEGSLYTFILATDEAHYEAYRLDFDEMVATARFSPPETGLQRLPGGLWLQREFRFAMQLPPEWKPAFGPNDKALFFATGAAHEVFTDNLLVLASPARELDLKQLQQDFPTEIAKVDPRVEVPSCVIVPQGTGSALETVIHTKRGPFEITVLERRFRGELRNYEVKFTCETAEFHKIQAELRKALDSFREFRDAPKQGIL
jgi:hypothetical protein